MPVPHISHDRSRAGFTMLELLLALSLSTVVLLAVGMNFLDFSRGFSSMGKLMYSRTRAQTIVDRMVEDIVGGQSSSLVPPAPLNSTSIEFKKITSVDSNGVPSFGNPIHIEMVPMESNTTDLIDNDGDGLVDEGGIRVWEDVPPYGPTPVDNPVILTDRVANGGLTFTLDGTLLKIDLTLQEIIETGKPPRDIRIPSGVKMRN